MTRVPIQPQSLLWKLTKWTIFVSVFAYAWLSGYLVITNSMEKTYGSAETMVVEDDTVKPRELDSLNDPNAESIRSAAGQFRKDWWRLGPSMFVLFSVVFLISLFLWARRTWKWSRYVEYADEVVEENLELWSTIRAARIGF